MAVSFSKVGVLCVVIPLPLLLPIRMMPKDLKNNLNALLNMGHTQLVGGKVIRLLSI